METVGNLSVFFTAVSDRYKCLSIIGPMSWCLEFCNNINDIKLFTLFDVRLVITFNNGLYTLKIDIAGLSYVKIRRDWHRNVREI